MKIRVRLECDEDGMFVITSPSLPGCISQGKTEREALKNFREAVRLHVRTLLEDSRPLFRKRNVKETSLEVSL
ncbi:MAG: type II toxin-antitoxin system HicB family antitoxin [Candidatus Omnitrophica bacterium]|nr:type II toxin-antitoxin system HicB family antitoxin [Candidatus Omnitrophota bacterium]